MKVKDSVASRCRWSEEWIDPYLDWDVIEDNSLDDYQGEVDIIFTDGCRYVFIEYSYGSCSVCDGFEELSEEQRQREFKDLTLLFECKDEYLNWKSRIYDASTNGH